MDSDLILKLPCLTLQRAKRELGAGRFASKTVKFFGGRLTTDDGPWHYYQGRTAAYWSRTVRIVSSKLFGVNGFGKHAWKPAPSMCARWSGIKKAVIAMTGALK